MSENLYLQPGTDGWSWLTLDDQSGVVRLHGEGGIEDLRQAITGMDWQGEVRVLVPGEDVLLTSANVPSRQRRQILQALPFMVEEDLAADIEETHFALGDRMEGGEVIVAAIARSKMRAWIDALKEIGIVPAAMKVDVLCTPYEGGTQVLLSAERVLVRLHKGLGLSLDRSLSSTLVQTLSEDQLDTLEVLIEPGQEEKSGLLLSELGASLDRQIKPFGLEYPLFETLARHYNPAGVELLQDEFKQEERVSDARKGWKSAGMLAASTLIVHLLLLTSQGFYLNMKAEQYALEVSGLYQDVFPGDRNVRDIRRRWRSHLNRGSTEGTGQFMKLFRQTSRHLPGSNLHLENVNFNESRGDLILQMQAQGSEQLVLFSQTLTQLGLAAEIGTISQDNDAVKGSIKIRVEEGA